MLQTILLVAPVVLFSFTAHEFAHGYAAWRQGDDTAKNLGLLNWNPRTYVDPLMTVILPIMTYASSGGTMILGGARSAPLDSSKYRHPRLGDIVVSLAGVTANLLVALLAAAAFVIVGWFGRALPIAESSAAILQAMCTVAMRLNLFLVLFNLLPLPPLDGSHVVKHLLPARLSLAYQRLAPYGLIVLIVLVFAGTGVLRTWMRPAVLGAELLVRELQPYMLTGTPLWLS